jgi:UDP-2,4-diacetamido-2,4,6-trideoxy-beta-L-altropyranose hydrolase
LAIGAAGSTSWERCCLGLPTIVVVLADNQMRIASALRNAGAAKQFAIDDEMYAMRESIIELCNDVDAISRFSALAAKVTDGAGTDRVIALMKAVRQE